MFRRVSIVIIAVAIIFASSAEASRFRWLGRSKTKTVRTTQKVSPATQKASVKSAKPQSKEIARVEKDVQRLESLLAGAKTSAKLSDKSWKSMANEAEMLAGRIYSNLKSATVEKDALRTAEQLRTHVQNMKKEAFKRDYRNTKRHAARALAAASRLDEWAG